MLREANNSFKIEGILSEVDLKEGSYTRDGKEIEYIGGTVKVRVNQIIGGKEYVSEVPVQLFQKKYTNVGAINKIYESYKKIPTEFASIAACGDENKADKVRLTRCRVTENIYPNTNNGKVTCYPRISGTFLNKVTGEFKPETIGDVQFYVCQKGYEVDKDGVETNRYKLTVAIPQYGGKVDLVDMFCANENVASSVSQSWEVGDTVQAKVKLNFTSKTETFTEELDFGEPIEKRRTTNVSDLYITGGSADPLEDALKFPRDEIKAALAERQTRYDDALNKAQQRTVKKTAAPAQNGGFDALGF